MRTLPVSNEFVRFNNAFRADEETAKTSVTDIVEANKKVEKPDKTGQIVTSALAIAALVGSGIAIARNPKKSGEVVDTAKDVSKQAMESLGNKYKQIISGLEEKISKLEAEGQKGTEEFRAAIEELRKYRQIITPLESKKNFFEEVVEVNGEKFNFATVLGGYGKREAELDAKLQTAATRHILGVREKLANAPDELYVRMPSSEWSGFAKTGGLAAVPPEMLAALSGLANKGQRIRAFADLPLYTGMVQEGKYWTLEKLSPEIIDGKLVEKARYIADREIELIKLDSKDINVISDTTKSLENVTRWLAKNQKQKVSTRLVFENMEPGLVKRIKSRLANGETVNAGAVTFMPAQEQAAFIKVKGADGNVSEISVDLDSLLEIFAPESAKYIKKHLAAGQNVDKKILTNFYDYHDLDCEMFKDSDVLKLVKDKFGGDVNLASKFVDFRFKAATPEQAIVTYDAVLYESPKFRMNGPTGYTEDGKIYKSAVNAGETERFAGAFSKDFTEFLFKDLESANPKIGCDVIIGNDWQTGGISAIMRLLAPAKAAVGDMSVKAAEKAENMPIMTLMHNFKLRGEAYHSQSRLMNMMFEEHAAKIARNAWMPGKDSMPGHLHNGLFSGTGINPQTMAMAYSDDIIFVSKGNFNEAANYVARGGVNYELAALRGRTGKFADKEYIKRIAMASGIDPAKVSFEPTARGITNGSDRVNNLLTKQVANKMELDLELPDNSIWSVEDVIRLNNEGKNGAYEVHKHNAWVGRLKVKEELDVAKHGGKNKMNIFDVEHTDLSGIDENTPWFGSAGRIVDQKGIDISAEGILQYYKSGKFDPKNPPVFYFQGDGDMKFIDGLLKVKDEVRKINPKAADRIVIAHLFSQPSRYDGAKIISDFIPMTSWDEPCGLVHKEISYFSGSVSMVNKVGGLTDGLHEIGAPETKGVGNAIFIDFIDKDSHSYEEAIKHNAEKTALAIQKAVELFNDKEKFAKAVEESYNGRYDWLSGKIQEYASIIKNKYGLLKESVNTNYTV